MQLTPHLAPLSPAPVAVTVLVMFLLLGVGSAHDSCLHDLRHGRRVQSSTVAVWQLTAIPALRQNAQGQVPVSLCKPAQQTGGVLLRQHSPLAYAWPQARAPGHCV